jgi:hypothetical protein
VVPKLRNSDEEKQDMLFKALVAKNMTLCGCKNNRELAARLHIGEKSFYLKIKDPDKFTRKELRRLFAILKFSEEEKGQVV